MTLGNTDDEIKELTHKYISCDEQSAQINDERARIRNRIEELGHSPKAFRDKIDRLKKDRKKQEGYDESYAVLSRIMDALDKTDLFSWMEKREAAKTAAREEKKAAREKQKATDDKYKPAPERKPTEGKVISVGEAQAKAFLDHAAE